MGTDADQCAVCDYSSRFPVHSKVLVLVLGCVPFCPSLPGSLCPHLLFLGPRAVAVKGVCQAYCPGVTLSYRVHPHVLRHPNSGASLRTLMLRSSLAASLFSALFPFLFCFRPPAWSHNGHLESQVNCTCGIWMDFFDKKIRLL